MLWFCYFRRTWADEGTAFVIVPLLCKMDSTHSDGKEARRWTFNLCQLIADMNEAQIEMEPGFASGPIFLSSACSDEQRCIFSMALNNARLNLPLKPAQLRAQSPSH